MKKEETRDGYGKAIRDLAAEHRDVFVMDCDLGRSTRAYKIAEVDPDRFLDLGISEQDMLSTAAGMASMGKTVFVNSFAVFLTGRAYDQIRQQIALPLTNVKICGSSAGITQGPDGATHQSVTDVNLMRGLPNMTVFNPADSRQAYEITKYAYSYKGPVYIRLSRFATENLIPEGLEFVFGKAQRLKEGRDTALLTSGPILKNVLEAAVILEKEGRSCGVYHFPTIKPLDQEILEELNGMYKNLITVEEHNIIGGLGSAVAEGLSGIRDRRTAARLVRIGIQDCFGESGTPDELLKKHGLDPDGLIRQIRMI